MIKKGIHLALIPVIALPTSVLAVGNATPPSLTPGQQETIRGLADPARRGEYLVLTPQAESLIPPGLEIMSTAEMKLPPEMAKLKFLLKGIKIVDNPIFCCEELLEPFQEYMGCIITLEKLEEIAHQITLCYQKAGYVLTQVIIPPQKIHDGIVTLRVIPGRIGKVEVTGNIKPGIKELLEEYGQRIQASDPLNIKVLERYLLLANDIPGVRVRSVLTPSKHMVGAADLMLVVEQKFDFGFISVNNFGTKYQGPIQYLANVEEYSKFCPADSTQFQYVTTGNKQLNTGMIRHSELICPDGLRWNNFGQILNSKPGSTLAPMQLLGIYKLGGTEFFYPFIRSRRQNFSFKGGFLVLDNKSNVLQSLFYRDRIRPVFGTLLYNFWDQLQGLNTAELGVMQGLKILNATGNALPSRIGGRSVFTRYNLTLTRTQPLPWHFSLFTFVTGQYTHQPLLSAMQFGFGGAYLGRGYDPSEIVGDKGIAGTVELRFYPFAGIHPSPKKQGGGFDIMRSLASLQIYGFIDMGAIWNVNPRAFIQHTSACSDGIGIRFNFIQYIDANFFIGKPLTRIVVANNNRHPRVFFSLTANLLP